MKKCILIWTLNCTWNKVGLSLLPKLTITSASQVQHLKNQCEQERTHILTDLMLSLENPRLAGYMLTGNRSMFLVTDGSLAWLYHCPLVHSPLDTRNRCYNQIPILYEGQIQFVDPITRHTHPAATLQNCTDRIKKLLQFDKDQGGSWYKLTPGIVQLNRPAVFGPKDVSPKQFIFFLDLKMPECTPEANSVVFRTIS